MKKYVILPCFIMLLLCSYAFGDDDTVLARAGDRKITQSDLKRIIGTYPAEQQEAFEQKPEYKVKLLQKLLQEMVLADDARRLGLDKEPDIMAQSGIMINSFLANELLKRELANKVKVTDSDVAIYYQLHKEDFRTPDMVRARHIMVEAGEKMDGNRKKIAREKAEGLLNRLKNGEDFAKLAAEVSDDIGSRKNGGDLGFFEKGKMVQEFEKALSLLNPGELSGIVETKFGYHIIKLEEKKTAGIQPLEEVKSMISNKLREEFKVTNSKEYLEKKMKDAKVEIYPDRVLKTTR